MPGPESVIGSAVCSWVVLGKSLKPPRFYTHSENQIWPDILLGGRCQSRAVQRLAVEGEVEFVCELLGAEGAAGEEAVADLEGRNFAAAVVDTENEVFGVG